MTQSIKTLIERLEKAGGPDQELDFAISREISGNHIVRYSSAHMDYTSSVDAAFTLIPDGCTWLLYSHQKHPTITAIIYSRVDLPNGLVEQESADGSSLPIALCIAALKSREATS